METSAFEGVIAKCRKEKRLTQVQLAELCEILIALKRKDESPVILPCPAI